MFNSKQNHVNNSKLIVADNPLSRAAEEFRFLRTTIQFAFDHQIPATITVTSPEDSNGNTTVAANLAASFAKERTMVLLVETNLRQPGFHRIFNNSNEVGLTDVLTDHEMKIGEVIRESQMHNLHYIPSGKKPLNPVELLNSNRMAQLFERMKNRYDVVIFDTPPLLATTEAQIIASKTDGTILVYPQGEMGAEKLKETADLLNDVKANVLGTVMNNVGNN